MAAGRGTSPLATLSTVDGRAAAWHERHDPSMVATHGAPHRTQRSGERPGAAGAPAAWARQFWAPVSTQTASQGVQTPTVGPSATAVGRMAPLQKGHRAPTEPTLALSAHREVTTPPAMRYQTESVIATPPHEKHG